MAFVAIASGPEGHPESLGIVRTITDPDNFSAEFSILVRSDLKGRGLGSLLMQKMIRYCCERGTNKMVGQVLARNTDMLRLAGRLGFVVHHASDDDIVDVSLRLNESR
jgi:acetyltransferase